MMADGACPSASGAKSSGLRRGWRELALDETLVPRDELGQYRGRVGGRCRFSPSLGLAGSGDHRRGETQAGGGDREPVVLQEPAAGWPAGTPVAIRLLASPLQCRRPDGVSALVGFSCWGSHRGLALLSRTRPGMVPEVWHHRFVCSGPELPLAAAPSRQPGSSGRSHPIAAESRREAGTPRRTMFFLNVY